MIHGLVRSRRSNRALRNGNHGALLTAVSQALNAFYNCLGADFGAAPGARNEVTVFTASEFARTLQSNGSGSDHGWGGVQMALGGAVNGGKLYSNGGGLISGFPCTCAGGSLSHRSPSVLTAGEIAGRTMNTVGVGISATYVNMHPMVRRRRAVICLSSSCRVSRRLPVRRELDDMR